MNTLPLSFRSLSPLHLHNRIVANRHALALVLVIFVVGVRTAHADDHAQCQTLGGRSTMFEPGYTPPEIQDNGLIQPNFVLLSGPWMETAYNGPVEPGESFTITYSFVPDGTTIPGTAQGENDAPSNLFATMDANFPGGRFAWQSVFHQVFARYGEMTNINFVFVPDDGASFGISYPYGIPGPGSPGETGKRGDMRISMRPIGDGPLARNYAPTFGGDMTMDSLDVAQFANPTDNFRLLRNVLAHEIGHGLGLDHVLPQNATKLMEPVLNTAFDGPQEDDLRGIHFLYGDRYERNEDETEYTDLGIEFQHPNDNGVSAYEFWNLSLERGESEDWYAVEIKESATGLPGLAIRVDPVGTTYDYGAQPEEGDPVDVVTVDAKSVRDLALQMYRVTSPANNQIQLITTLDFGGPGEGEYRPSVLYPAAGTYLVRVYSNDDIDDVQRYQLTLSNGEIEAPQAEPSMLLSQGVNAYPSGSIVDLPPSEVGKHSGLSMTISNNGEGPLEILGHLLVGPAAGDYTVQYPAQPIQPGGFGVLSIGFSPTAAGFRAAQVSIASNDPAGNYELTMRATAAEPPIGALAVSVEGTNVANGGTVELGELELGGEYEIVVDLENVGNGSMNVINTSILGDNTPDFERLSDLPLTLNVNATGEIALLVTPTSEGEKNTTLRMFNNGTQSPYDVIFSYSVVAVELFDDCNSNGIDDETELDSDGNGIIDECEVVTPPVDDEDDPIVGGDPNDGGNEGNVDDNDNDGNIGNDNDDNDDNDQDVIDGGNVDDNNNGNVDEDNDNDDLGGNNDQDDDREDEDREEKRTGFCGAGSIGMLTLTMLGLSGTRVRRRRLVS